MAKLSARGRTELVSAVLVWTGRDKVKRKREIRIMSDLNMLHKLTTPGLHGNLTMSDGWRNAGKIETHLITPWALRMRKEGWTIAVK